jgi:hypothetical protein
MIYSYKNNNFEMITKTTFTTEKIRERDDIQRILGDKPEVISKDLLIISEEFSRWDESNRRVDLLGVDRLGCLVVIEIKRTEDAGHSELQAIRYAAMLSTMTFEQAVDTYSLYLARRDIININPKERLEQHIGEEAEASFNKKVRLIIVSANYSKEVTTSVLWLNDQGLDITCIKIQPYKLEDQILFHIDQIIPLPEAMDFQIAVRHQNAERKNAEISNRDYTKYRLSANGEIYEDLNKRKLIYLCIKKAIESGVPISIIESKISWRKKLFHHFSNSIDLKTQIENLDKSRYFLEDDQIFKDEFGHHALTNQWGSNTEEAAKNISELVPGIRFEPI